jgi:hypothetical protein
MLKVIINQPYYSKSKGALAAAEFVVHGGPAAVNRGADFVQYLVQSPLAPEQGTGPVTAHRSIKRRLLDRRTAPVSTAIKIVY